MHSTIEILKKLITYKTITPREENIYEYIKNILDDFEFIHIDKNGIKNLFIYKTNSIGPHLCFAGHIDVVPPAEGWESDPFIPTIKDEFIYGRGSQDMKSGVAASISAVKENQNFKGTISLLLTSDEEGDGEFGTLEVLEYLKNKNFLPDLCIVGEPTCEKDFGDSIKVGRRGSINGYLTINGKSGHAAYPQKCINPLHNFGKFLDAIAGKKLDNGDDNFAPSQIVITDLKSGYGVTNLTPGDLKMMFNIRNSTNTSKDDVEQFIRTNLQKFDIKNYELKLKQGSFPFITKNGKFSKTLVGTLKNSITQVTNITPKNSTSGGTSDARYISAYNIDVVEFGVINDRIHGANERVSLKELQDLHLIYSNFIKNLGS